MGLAFYTSTKKTLTFSFSKKFHLKKTFQWALFGIATGIKLFALFSVMPQYLINHLGHLPYWYGVMIFINSLSIILFQIPVMNFIRKFNLKNQIRVTVFLMIIGMFVIAAPGFFHLQFMMGALLWTILLSIIEASASYLDTISSQNGYLLTKEITSSIGGGITILFSRYLSVNYSSTIIAFVGILCLIIAYALTEKTVAEI